MQTYRHNVSVSQELHELGGINTPPRPPKVPLTDSQHAFVNPSRYDTERLWKKQTFRQKWLGGLRMSLRLWVTMSALVLAMNVSWLVWAWRKYNPTNGYGILQNGDCDTAQDLNRWLHLIINVLSTILLMASAAFMNAAAAPSEEEIRLAHRSGSWLNIGLLSFHNARGVSIKKTMIVSVLALTSVPVHLFFNSVVFPALAGNDYLWAVTTEDFVGGANFDLSQSNLNIHFEGAGESATELFNNSSDVSLVQFTSMYRNIQANLDRYERLDNANCLKEYSQKLVHHHRDLILVSSTTNLSNSVLVWYFSIIDNEGSANPTNWICSQDPGESDYACDAQPYLSDPGNWTVFEHPILYCLAEKVEAVCSVEYSTSLAIIVIICNALKLGVEIYILLWKDLDKAITCVGDAIATSLTSPDVLLEHMSLYSDTKLLPGLLRTPVHQRQPVQYRLSRPRWGTAITRQRWMSSIIVLLLAIAFVLILFAWGLSFIASKGFQYGITGLWRLGFGNIDPEILIASENFGNPATLSLLANIPQLILAIIYYMYGGMLTTLFTAREYAKFANKEQYLRVACPLGKQQGTWILGMPFVWGMVFQVIQILLHWFVSQGFFVVDVSVYNIDGTLNNQFGSISNCGFSPFPIFCAVLTATLMMLIVVCLGSRRLPARCPPVVGSNSALIAAACQPRSFWDERLPYLPLKWGCIENDSQGVGHCSFILAESEPKAQPLVEGRFYR